MKPGLVVEKSIGPDHLGSGKDEVRFSSLNDQAKKPSSSGTLVRWISAPPRPIFWILPPLGPLGVITVTGHVISTLGYRRFSTPMTVAFRWPVQISTSRSERPSYSPRVLFLMTPTTNPIAIKVRRTTSMVTDSIITNLIMTF